MGAFDAGPDVGHGPAGQLSPPGQLRTLHGLSERARLPVVHARVLARSLGQDLVAPEQLLGPLDGGHDVEQGDRRRLPGQPEAPAGSGHRRQDPGPDQGLELLVQVGRGQLVERREGRGRHRGVQPAEVEACVEGPFDALTHPHGPGLYMSRISTILDISYPGFAEGATMTLVRAAQAEVLESDPASVITLLLDPEHTGGVLTSNRTLLRSGTDGAPPHRHTRSGELFFVLDGALEMLVGEELHILRKGDALFVAPNQSHAFAPADGHDADFLVVITPG